jgi:hypothetical protein
MDFSGMFDGRARDLAAREGEPAVDEHRRQLPTHPHRLIAFIATAIAGAVILATDWTRADGVAALFAAAVMLRFIDDVERVVSITTTTRDHKAVAKRLSGSAGRRRRAGRLAATRFMSPPGT